MAAGRGHLTALAVVAMTMASTAPLFGATDPHAPAKAATPKPATPAPAKPATPAPAKPAEHAAAKPAAHAAAKPAEHAPVKTPPAAAGHAKPTAAAAAAPAAPAQAPNSLIDVRDRIMTRAAEVAATWKKAPAAAPRRATTPAPARVRVVWRAAVSWPAELSGDVNEAPAALASERIPVSWDAPER